MEALPPDEWHPYAEGTTIGTRGSEEGTVVIDQEYRTDARITLERDCPIGPFAITCGILSMMVHTHFESTLEDAVCIFGDMKDDLERIVSMAYQQVNEDDEAYTNRIIDELHIFVERYW